MENPPLARGSPHTARGLAGYVLRSLEHAMGPKAAFATASVRGVLGQDVCPENLDPPRYQRFLADFALQSSAYIVPSFAVGIEIRHTHRYDYFEEY